MPLVNIFSDDKMKLSLDKILFGISGALTGLAIGLWINDCNLESGIALAGSYVSMFGVIGTIINENINEKTYR